MTRTLQPATFEDAASALAAATAEGQTVRIRGGGTKLGWGRPVPDPDVELHSAQLDRILEHNHGDLTAVLQAGVPLQRAQEQFASRAQMLALDPPLGGEDSEAATVGGVIATADAGPRAHRYGTPRDLVVGMTVALSDGTIARSGGKVIKNVAGYDIAKLMTGSFGTLAMILSVSVRLHPLPTTTATTFGATADPNVLAQACQAVARAPLELEALDFAWRRGRGGVLAQSAGAEPPRRAARVAEVMREAGLEQVEITTDDEKLWARQRAGQRSTGGAIVRVSAPPSSLPEVLDAAERSGATTVGRAALGTSFLELDPSAVPALVQRFSQNAFWQVLEAPAELRETLEPWSSLPGSTLELMQRVKARFDPARTCNPGLFVGGI